jgi:hypothetical protein
VEGSSYFGKKKTPEDVAKEIAGIKPVEVTESEINNNPEEHSRMNRESVMVINKEIIEYGNKNKNFGTRNEDQARSWYIERCKSLNLTVKVLEVGLAVPKFDPRIGMSPDGIVTGGTGGANYVGGTNGTGTFVGLIEIKCPQKFYRPLAEYESNGKPYSKDFQHIWRSHYAQMQMGMQIFNKEWCDYIVYCIPENRVFIERIPRNREYWEELYSKVKVFINDILNPILKLNNPYGYPLCPPNSSIPF